MEKSSSDSKLTEMTTTHSMNKKANTIRRLVITILKILRMCSCKKKKHDKT